MHYSLSDTTCDPLGLLEKELSFQFQGANYLNQFEWELRFLYSWSLSVWLVETKPIISIS